jgi:hypothetical protein
MEVTKCLERKDKIKMVIVPKKSSISKGDCVAIIKLDEKEVLENGRREKN